MLPAEVMDVASALVSANSPKFQVDNSARLQFNGRSRVTHVVDAFVQTKRSLQS
jgi:hypothetical protein